MKKLGIAIVLVCLGTLYGYTRSLNWYPYNATVTNSVSIVSPFTNGGIKIQNQGSATLDVGITNEGITATFNVYPYSKIEDLYTLRFSTLYNPTINIYSTGTTIGYVWYEEND